MLDLHVHSTASDGTCTPGAVAEAGRGFACLALTDHDNTSGCDAFLAACARGGHTGLRLAGIELSVEAGAGYDTFHMLGLGIDPHAACLTDFLARVGAGRDERNVRILRRLAELGVAVSFDEVRAHASGAVVARPHIARALVARGLARDVRDAFAKYIGRGASAYVERYRPKPEEAIEVLHRAGGLAVMAHPRQWTQDPAALRAGLVRLKDLGLDGIEAYYQANTPLETATSLRLARELDLLVTAGSDFHGSNRHATPLGMSVEDEARLISSLESALTRRPPTP